MSWRTFVLSSSASLCLIPASLMAQSESESPAPVAEPASSAPETPQVPEVKDAPPAPTSVQGLLGDLRVGPSVALGVPHPLTAGVDLVYADFVALSVSAGRVGTEIEETEIEIRNWDVALRWFPFGGSFFLGAAYGNQGVVGKRTEDLVVDASGTQLTVPTTVRLEIESNYFTPQLGWFARWDSGFTLGFDVGVQLPQSPNSELQTSFENVSAASETAVRNSPDYIKTKKDVEDAAELIGKKALPYINLIRIGWLF